MTVEMNTSIKEQDGYKDDRKDEYIHEMRGWIKDDRRDEYIHERIGQL